MNLHEDDWDIDAWAPIHHEDDSGLALLADVIFGMAILAAIFAVLWVVYALA